MTGTHGHNPTAGERVESLYLRLGHQARKMGAGSLLMAGGAAVGALLLATTLVFPSSTVGNAIRSLPGNIPGFDAPRVSETSESEPKATRPSTAAEASSGPAALAVTPSVAEETYVLSSSAARASSTGDSTGGPSLATNAATPTDEDAGASGRGPGTDKAEDEAQGKGKDEAKGQDEAKPAADKAGSAGSSAGPAKPAKPKETAPSSSPKKSEKPSAPKHSTAPKKASPGSGGSAPKKTSQPKGTKRRSNRSHP